MARRSPASLDTTTINGEGYATSTPAPGAGRRGDGTGHDGQCLRRCDAVCPACRFEFYDFAGSVEELALCSASGKKPDECDPDVNPDLVGHLIGAQMGALNLDLLAPLEPAPVPLPPGLPAMLSGLVALALIGRRRNPLR